jgi:hypothetical protein
MYKRNIEARSHKNCCPEKQLVLYILDVCSHSYQACNVHAVYNIVVCGLPGSTIFFHIISLMGRLWEKSY